MLLRAPSARQYSDGRSSCCLRVVWFLTCLWAQTAWAKFHEAPTCRFSVGLWEKGDRGLGDLSFLRRRRYAKGCGCYPPPTRR